MSLLDHPEAQAILADAVVTPDAVEGQADRLSSFLQRYLPRFYRSEQRATAALVIRGRLGGLERKTSEPIAIEAGLPRKPIQFFVGAGKWDDEAVMGELRRHVGEELADPDGVVIVDPSGFPKKGAESCGVDRQWCGRLGKVDNCQVGVFLAYATTAGYAPLDRRLYLPREWADDEDRREKCHVPEEVEFQEIWRIALDLLDRSLPGLPHGWIVGDDELGPGLRVPRRVAAAGRTLCPGRAVQHHRARPGAASPAPQEGRRRPQTRGAVREGRCLGRTTAGVTLGADHGPRRREGPSGGRCDGRAGPDQAGRACRAGGAAGGHPPGRRVAGRLRPEQRGPRDSPGRGGPGPAATAPDRGGVRRRQGRGRAGSLRGPELGGMAPSHDAVPGGVVVPVPGTTASRGGKPRRSPCRRRGTSWPACSATRRRARTRSPARCRGC